jgi:DNA polymerase III sliding clamp (beta) subunit (PCNA family)
MPLLYGDPARMSATVSADDLFRALRLVKKCAASPLRPYGPGRARRRGRLPILTHVKIDVAGEDLWLTCTNLRVADVARVRTMGSSADGGFCAPVRLLTDIAGRLRELGEPMTLVVQPGRIAAWGSDDDYEQDRDLPSVLTISCGAAQFRLVGFPILDFPLIDAIPRPDTDRAVEELTPSVKKVDVPLDQIAAERRADG